MIAQMAKMDVMNEMMDTHVEEEEHENRVVWGSFKKYKINCNVSCVCTIFVHVLLTTLMCT